MVEKGYDFVSMLEVNSTQEYNGETRVRNALRHNHDAQRSFTADFTR
jgi:hypothetical protein